MEKKIKIRHLAHYLPHGLRVQTEDGIFEVDGWSGELGIFLNTEMYGANAIPYYKPILRPLLDLIKDPKHILGMGYRTLSYDGKEASYTVKQYQYLFKNHFDIFGLIESGLAIDINTI